MIKTIKINIAYKDVAVYDYDGSIRNYDSNASNIDIHQPLYMRGEYSYYLKDWLKNNFKITFPYKINGGESLELLYHLNAFYSQEFERHFDNSFNNFYVGKLSEFIENDKNFIYPILLSHNKIFEKYNTFDLPNELLPALQSGKAKIIFIYPFEGNFGVEFENYYWMSRLSLKYNLKKESLVVITPNMSAKDTYDNLISLNLLLDNFTIYPFSYFSHHFMYYSFDKLDTNNKKIMYNTFFDLLDNNRRKHKKYHFLCFNRVHKSHRLCIFAELNTNDYFKGKYITTLQKRNDVDASCFKKSVDSLLKNDYKFEKRRLLNFYEIYDSTKNCTYDSDNLDDNKAFILNTEAHNNSFVNIVTESLYDENSVFFTEKTFKPMCTCQPFIFISTAHSLKKLKDLGYKTFDRWWDESYDNELDFTRRFEKIIEIMIDISTWSLEKCFKITNEMEEILLHNFNKLMSDKETIDLYNFLNCETKNMLDDISNISKTNINKINSEVYKKRII